MQEMFPVVNDSFHRLCATVFANCFCILISLSMCCSTTVPFHDIQNSPVLRVVNGWEAKLGDAPYQVALKALIVKQNRTQHRKLYGTFCGAAIVGPKKLITAAHCIKPRQESKSLIFKSSGYVDEKHLHAIFAVAGNLRNRAAFSPIDSKRNGQWRSLSKAYYPRQYLFPMHDIALAWTLKSFSFNEYVAPIPVASTNVEYSGPCLVSGFGRISTGEKTKRLILAYLDIMPASTCSQIHKKNMKLFVCTSMKVSDVARGDSGGPLVCKNTGDPEEGEKGLLVGIVSGHRPYAGSFFTRVSKYNEFLENGYSTSVHNHIFLVYLVSLTISVINGALFLF